ncbi:MAG TPA: Ig-like domain-containing protein [Leptospiraceae bacterium]|nr:Ig-like domain-containing protein [Leptospiraceae bacterium]
MKKTIYLIILALLFTAGCSKKEKKYIPFSMNNASNAPTGNASTNVTGATLSQIRVTPADQSIARNTHANYRATGVYSDGTIKDITEDCTWSVKSETDKASEVSSKKGRFLGTGATTSGSPAKVNASLGSLSGDANLNITSASLSSIQISSVPSLIPGGQAQYIATGIFSDGTTQDISSLVNWSSSNSSNVSIDVSTGAGVGGSTAGTATITATLISPSTFPGVANGGSATTTTQLKNVTIVSITVTGLSEVGAGTTANYQASAIYSDGTSSDITSVATWSVDSATNAAVSDSSGSKGVLTTISNGSVNVQASYVGVTGTKLVTISSITISSISVSPSSKTIIKGTTTQFTATANYSNGTSADISNTAVWTSSNTSIAGVNTSTSNGGLAQGINTGSVTITVASGGKTATASLSVSAATLVSISINTNASIAKGTTRQYTATGTYSDGTVLDISSLVTWSSSSGSVVAISNTSGTKGLATGSSQGSSTIQASLNGVNSNTSTLTVTAETLTSISIGSNASVAAGGTKQYSATGTFSDATTQDITSLVTWTSSSAANATISNASSDKGKAYGLAAGTTNITASLPNGTNGITTSGGTIVSNTSVLTVTAASNGSTASVSAVTVGAYDVTIPSGINTTTTPTGNFSGLTYNTANNAAGFIAQIPDYSSPTFTCQAQGTAILGKILADSPDLVSSYSQNSVNTVNFTGGCTITYNLSITTSSSKKATELSNHLISNVGILAVGGGSVTSLPASQSGETATTAFRAIVQVTYKTGTGGQTIGIGVTNSADYAANQALLESFLGGTNIAVTGTTYLTKTETKTGKAMPKVDFVWVIDNSASTSTIQTSISGAATTFFNKLGGKNLDYRLGVIATGGDGTDATRTDKCTNPVTPGEQLRSNGWMTSSNTAAEFSGSGGTGVGSKGCGTESGIYYAAKSLGYPNSITYTTTPTVTPRSGSSWGSDYKLVFVIVSDEGDQFRCYNGTYSAGSNSSGTPCSGATGNTDFDNNNNVFVNNGYKVHTITGLDSSGNPGSCSVSGGPSTSQGNVTWPGYKNLSTATGGVAASVCSTDYNAIMDTIVNAVAGDSGYILAKNPVSSSITVKVNGSAVAQDSTNGWQYVPATNSIIFSGTAWPATNASIEISYLYSSDQGAFLKMDSNSSLMAYISQTAKSSAARGTAATIALIVGAILAGRLWRRRNSNK